MYYIGIDFGHGETTVSRVPGYNGERVSQIAIKQSNDYEGKKIVSAICKKNNQWSLVYEEQDYYLSEDIRQGFKGRISILSDREKESLRVFAKLIFSAILENDTALEYRSSDDRNFELGIACPSYWIREDPKAQQEYLDFFREECGLPIDYCIKESDAACTKYDKYNVGDNVFIINLGSSTIDFTTYSQSKCIASCCWGERLGTHMIEDAIMSHILRDENNAENLKKLMAFRLSNGFTGDVNNDLSLIVRRKIEAFFREDNYWCSFRDTFSVYITYHDLTPRWPGTAWDKCIGFKATKEEFYNIIADCISGIKEALSNAKIKLNLNGVAPSRVLLLGDAGRMSFVREYAEQIFGVKVEDFDQQPECVVSNGIALYISSIGEQFNRFIHELQSEPGLDRINVLNMDYSLIDRAIVNAIQKALPSKTNIQGVDSKKYLAIGSHLFTSNQDIDHVLTKKIIRYAVKEFRKYLLYDTAFGYN